MLILQSNLSPNAVLLASFACDIHARYGLEEKKWTCNTKLLPYPFNIAEINSEADWEECRQIYAMNKPKKKEPMKSKYSWILYKGVIDKTPEPPPKKSVEPTIPNDTNPGGWLKVEPSTWNIISFDESNEMVTTYQKILEIIDNEKGKILQGI